MQLPVFLAGTTLITTELAFACQDGKVVCVYVCLPVFQQTIGDVAAFRLFTRQLVVNGTASQAGIARAFHVPSKTVKRLWEGGAKSFFETPRRRSAPVLACDSFPIRLFSTPAASAKIAAQAARPPPGKSQVVQSGAAGGPAQE